MTWPTATLGEISKGAGQYGVGLSSREWRVGDPRYIRITDIDDEGRLNSSVVAPDGGRSDWEKAILQEGDLLFARSGATVGKTYLHGADAPPAVYAGYLIRFQLDTNRALPDYVFRFTQGAAYRAWVASSQRAVAQPNINAKQYASLPIPLPSLDQQRRIAALLDHANDLREKRSQAMARIDQLVLAVFTNSFGDPIRNQKGWPMMELGDLGEWHSGATPPRAEEHYFRGETPWYSSGELGPLFTTGSAECVSEEAFRKTSLKPVPAGALMLGMYDTAAFKSSIASKDCACNQAIAFSRLDPDMAETVYVYFAIKLASERLRQLRRGIRQKNLNLSIVRSIKIPLAPLDLQAAFARQVAALRVNTDLMAESAGQLHVLFHALQSRAFSGQL